MPLTNYTELPVPESPERGLILESNIIQLLLFCQKTLWTKSRHSPCQLSPFQYQIVPKLLRTFPNDAASSLIHPDSSYAILELWIACSPVGVQTGHM